MELPGISPESFVKKNENFYATEVDDSIVILNIEDGKYYYLKNVAKKIWEILDAPCPVKDICTRLLDYYSDVSPDHCEEKTRSFLESLAQKQLISIT